MKTLLLTEIQLNHIVALIIESKKEEFLKKKKNMVINYQMKYLIELLKLTQLQAINIVNG